MRARLRRIGNSKGVIIPDSLLASCGIELEVDMRAEGRTIVPEATSNLRKGWFEGYDPENEEECREFLDWEGLEVAEPSGDWEW